MRVILIRCKGNENYNPYCGGMFNTKSNIWVENKTSKCKKIGKVFGCALFQSTYSPPLFVLSLNVGHSLLITAIHRLASHSGPSAFRTII